MASMSGTIDPTSLTSGRESRAVRWALTSVAVLFLTLFVLVPIGNIFSQALGAGWRAYVHTFGAPEQAAVTVDATLPVRERLEARGAAARGYAQAKKTQSAIKMTLGVAAIVVPLNTLFGIAAAWAI